MKAKWDGKRTVEVTDRYKAALVELVEAEIEMMRRTPGLNKECWTWGEATVGDLALANGLRLTFGGDVEKPKDLKEMSHVIIS